MSCNVYIYDHGQASISSSAIELVVMDHDTRILLAQRTNNTKMGSLGYGAALQFRNGQFSYAVFINDTQRTYGPASLYPLNGKVDGTLHITLYPSPSPNYSRIGNAPGNFNEIAAYIQRQSWTKEEKQSVRMLVSAFQFARAGWDTKIGQIPEQWAMQLLAFDIEPRLI